MNPNSETHRVCKACRHQLPKEDYFLNHWKKPEGCEFSRCKSCVKAGIFEVTESDGNIYWVGWPKCPVQVLIERGWSPPRNATFKDYSPEKIGQLILSMPDHEWLLNNFAVAGHYGYGGLDEGLCSMPGCVRDTGLKMCTHCYEHRYCCVEHQRMHWSVHSNEYENKKRARGVRSLEENPNQNVFTESEKRLRLMTTSQKPLHNREQQSQQQPPPPPPQQKQSKHYQQDQKQSPICREVQLKRPEPKGPSSSTVDSNGVSKLVFPDDQKLSTRFSFAVLSEYGPCKFRESDRQGKRKGLQIGFPGMQCIHCWGLSRKGGRFFPSTIKTMADTKKTLISIQNHLIKCNKCPHDIKESIVLLRESHEDERKQQKYGSQKAFFLKIWNRLHGGSDFEIGDPSKEYS